MSSFRTVKQAPYPDDAEHLRFVNVKSEHLKGRGDITFFIPPSSETGCPLLILLHGVYGSHWEWVCEGKVHQTALELIARDQIRPMVIAMPSDGLWGDGSGYFAHNELDFTAWIADDVSTVSRELFEPVREHAPQFICGLSMGGFGALRIGASHPNQFRGISAHSAITDMEGLNRFVEEPPEAYRRSEGSVEPAVDVIRRHRENLPPLRFDCGREDDLYEKNQKLHQQLTKEHIPHTFDSFPGGHEWTYWKQHVSTSLQFFENVLSEEPKT